MREIDTGIITSEISRMCSYVNRHLPDEIIGSLCDATKTETNALAKSALNIMIESAQKAERLDIPICQDTGAVVVFAEVGQDCHLIGDTLEEAINKGVAEAYSTDCLRCSIAADPVTRGNTGDNTPAFVHTALTKGDTVKLTLAAKGCGSENMSKVVMLNPTAGRQGIIDAVVSVVKDAGSNPCPPMVIGVGIGGNFETSALLAKRALCRDGYNDDNYYSELERDLLAVVNQTGIGVQGFGGDTTALKVSVESAPTHIAGLPLAVNIGCYVNRHTTTYI